MKGQTNPQPKKERGGKSKWRVCVYCWGRQSSAILSHLSKLTWGEANKNAKKTETKNTKKHHTNTRKSQTNKKGGKPTKPNRTEGSEAGRTRKKRGAGGRRQAEASRKGKRGPPGRQQGQEGENRTAKEAGACSVSGVLRGFWITQGRIPQHPSQHPWCLVHPMKDLRMSPAPSGPARLLARGCSWSSWACSRWARSRWASK